MQKVIKQQIKGVEFFAGNVHGFVQVGLQGTNVQPTTKL
jgi:hypothetical protein